MFLPGHEAAVEAERRTPRAGSLFSTRDFSPRWWERQRLRNDLSRWWRWKL